MNDFIKHDMLKNIRHNKLIEMTSFNDQTGLEPHEKDVDKIMELDRQILKLTDGWE